MSDEALRRGHHSSPRPSGVGWVRGDSNVDQCSSREVTGTFLRALLRDALEEISEVAAPFARREGASEGVASIRSLRLALRRVQYLVEGLAPLEGSWATSTMAQQVKCVVRPLGGLRDAEVVESRVASALEVGAPSPRALRLSSAATKYREAAGEVAHCGLDSSDFHSLLQSMRLYRVGLREAPLSLNVLRPIAHDVLIRSWGDLERSVARAKGDPNDDNLHRARRAAKRLAVLLRTFSLTLDPSVDTVSEHLDAFQRNLGQQRDSSLVANWLRREASRDGELVKVAITLAQSEERRAQKRRRRWARLWRELRDRAGDFPGPSGPDFPLGDGAPLAPGSGAGAEVRP